MHDGSQVTQVFAQPKRQGTISPATAVSSTSHDTSCSATTTTAAASFSATCLVRAKPSLFHSYAFASGEARNGQGALSTLASKASFNQVRAALQPAVAGTARQNNQQQKPSSVPHPFAEQQVELQQTQQQVQPRVQQQQQAQQQSQQRAGHHHHQQQ
jgi:hypothetical protein